MQLAALRSLLGQAGSVANPHATPAGANAFGGPAIRAVIAVVSEEGSAEEAAPMVMEIAGKPAAMVEVAAIEMTAVEMASAEMVAAGEMATAKMAAAQAATTKVAAAAHSAAASHAEAAAAAVTAATATATASAATPASCERFMGEADAAKREDRSNGRNFE
jgi:hypothetical protein